MSSHCFRSTAEMIADGTVRRPAYLDADSPFTEPGDIVSVPRTPAPSKRAFATAPVAGAAGEETAADQNRRLRNPDRIGRLFH